MGIERLTGIMSFSVVSLVLLLNGCLAQVTYPGGGSSGRSCETKARESGICKSFLECPAAREDIYKGIYPTICRYGSGGIRNIDVCCPNRNIPLPTIDHFAKFADVCGRVSRVRISQKFRHAQILPSVPTAFFIDSTLKPQETLTRLIRQTGSRQLSSVQNLKLPSDVRLTPAVESPSIQELLELLREQEGSGLRKPSVGFGEVRPTYKPTVVGGEDAQRNSWPWMVRLATENDKEPTPFNRFSELLAEQSNLTKGSLQHEAVEETQLALPLERNVRGVEVTGGEGALRNAWPWMVHLASENDKEQPLFDSFSELLAEQTNPAKRSLQFEAMEETRLVMELKQHSVAGGEDAERNAWPWMALFGRRQGAEYDWFCGGALITDRHILTAAHCFDRISKPDVVRLGEHDLSQTDESPHIDVPASTVYRHKGFFSPAVEHDIAVVKLRSPVAFNHYIHPICMPLSDVTPASVGIRGTITGWGTLSFGGRSSDILQQVSVPIVDKGACETAYKRSSSYSRNFPRGFPDNLFCASEEQGGKDACQGDSGGPFMIYDLGKYRVSGVVSAGQGCGSKTYPGLYTWVFPYMEWLQETVAK